MSDSEVARIRDHIYRIVEGLLLAYPYFSGPDKRVFGVTSEALAYAEQMADRSEEHVAKLQFDAGYPERYAIAEVCRALFEDFAKQKATKELPTAERKGA